MKKHKPERARRPKRHESTIATAIARDHVDLHTKAIAARRDLLLFERKQIVERTNALQAALTSAKQNLAAIDAALVGLDSVLACRTVSAVEVF